MAADVVSSMRERLQRSLAVYEGASESSHLSAEQARRVARRFMDNAAESSSIAQLENANIQARLLQIDQLCTGQFEALAIQKEHIGKNEAYQQSLRDALDIKDKHIEQIEGHIARLDTVLSEKAEYQAQLEAQRDEYDLALTKTTQYVSKVEAQRSRYDEALVSAVAYLHGVELDFAESETSLEHVDEAGLAAKIGEYEAILRKTAGYVKELDALLVDARRGE